MPNSFGDLVCVSVYPERDENKQVTGYMTATFEDGSQVKMTNAQSNALARYWTRD